MQTFFEFLHGDGWKKPLLPANNNAVTARIIRSGQQGNTRSDLGTFPDGQTNAWRSTTKMPSHQLLMLILWRRRSAGHDPRRYREHVEPGRQSLG